MIPLTQNAKVSASGLTELTSASNWPRAAVPLLLCFHLLSHSELQNLISLCLYEHLAFELVVVINTVYNNSKKTLPFFPAYLVSVQRPWEMKTGRSENRETRTVVRMNFQQRS